MTVLLLVLFTSWLNLKAAANFIERYCISCNHGNQVLDTSLISCQNTEDRIEADQ